jgi:agmatine deiminase
MAKAIFAAILFFSLTSWAMRPDLKTLPRGFAPQEQQLRTAFQISAKAGPLPIGPIQSLGEWEDADAILTLWPNPSYLKALSDNGKVILLADDETSSDWWKNYLASKNISAANFTYFSVPTDSIWIRDYGPFWIVDGNGVLASVDTVYNRPSRKLDDKVPAFIASQIGIKNYQPGVVHTGGNYYSDGTGNAFSSTLVQKENSALSATELLKRMFDFLGLTRYTTTSLGAGVTIEHLDTFGKLVAPDTWVIGDFPAGTTFKKDADTLVSLLKGQVSPYGTPYRIFKLKMVGQGTEFRAYINSFIHNRTLFFPSYGDTADDEVAKIYQQALPGYKIVPVENGRTLWGDSVHCRSRNLISKNTIFIFPHVKPSKTRESSLVQARIIASPGQTLSGLPKVHWAINGKIAGSIAMSKLQSDEFEAFVPRPNRSETVTFYIEAQDTGGKMKRAPSNAPSRGIQVL